MKKYKFLLFITYLILIIISPLNVSAKIFKDGEAILVLDERDTSCVDNILTDGYKIANAIDNDLIFSDYYEEDYVKVSSEGKCEKLTLEEIFSSRKAYISYSLEKNEDKYLIKEDSTTFYKNYYIKTKDTEIDKNKTYYTIINGYRDEEVIEPKKSELENYYEKEFMNHYDKTTIDPTLTYYKRVGNTIEVTKVENPIENEIQYYYISMPNDRKEDSKVVAEVSENIYKLILNTTYSIIKNPEINEFYIIIQKQNEDLDDSQTYVDIYDQQGNKIYNNVEDLIPLHNSLFFVHKVRENTDPKEPIYSFDIYNTKKSINEKITSIDNIRIISELGYSNYNSLLYGYVYDEIEDEEINKYYDLRIYKIIEGENLTYNDKDIIIKTSGDVNKISNIYINNKELEKFNYSLESGSTILTLKKDYLKTLSNGIYNIKIDYTDGGYVETTFNIMNSHAEHSYEVMFDANGGTFKNNESTLIITEWKNDYEKTLEIPTKEGYEFIGYFTEKSGGTSLEKYLAEAGIDDNLTFYAQWKENIIQIEEENPETYDAVNNILFIGIISSITLIYATIYLKNKNNLRAHK